MPRHPGGFAVALVALVALALTGPPAGAKDALPPDEAVRALLAARVATRRSPGIVVGLLDAGGTRVVAVGTSGREGLPLDGRTLFEVGSVAKVFTAALLLEMSARGEVRPDDPLTALLPAEVTVPARGERPIRLIDLATHSSGLPRLPTNLVAADPDDPYADYTVADLYAFLGGYALPRDVGAGWEYSNLGTGLLGHALALRAEHANAGTPHLPGGPNLCNPSQRLWGGVGQAAEWGTRCPPQAGRERSSPRSVGCPRPLPQQTRP